MLHATFDAPRKQIVLMLLPRKSCLQVCYCDLCCRLQNVIGSCPCSITKVPISRLMDPQRGLCWSCFAEAPGTIPATRKENLMLTEPE